MLLVKDWEVGESVQQESENRGYSSVLRTVDQLSILDTEEDLC